MKSTEDTREITPTKTNNVKTLMRDGFHKGLETSIPKSLSVWRNEFPESYKTYMSESEKIFESNKGHSEYLAAQMTLFSESIQTLRKKNSKYIPYTPDKDLKLIIGNLVELVEAVTANSPAHCTRFLDFGAKGLSRERRAYLDEVDTYNASILQGLANGKKVPGTNPGEVIGQDFLLVFKESGLSREDLELLSQRGSTDKRRCATHTKLLKSIVSIKGSAGHRLRLDTVSEAFAKQLNASL